jgi:hypothetical protein
LPGVTYFPYTEVYHLLRYALTVDPRLVDVRRVPDEVRYRVPDYLWSRG